MGHMEQKKRQPLSRRITIQLGILMLIMTAAVSIISYQSLKSTYMRLYSENAQDVVRLLASRIDGDQLAAYAETGVTDAYYEWLQSEFNQVKSEYSGIQYLYLFHPKEDHFIYILDSYRAGDDLDKINKMGDRYTYGETELAHLVPDIQAGRASDELIQGQDVGYGQTISAWAPVFDSQGVVTGMVEADCVLSELKAVVRTYALRIVETLILFILIVLLLTFRCLRRNVIEPVDKLTEMVDSYEHGAIKETKFRHNDEMQLLASSFTDMTHRIEAYTDELAAATTEKERIRAEFNVAKQIQADILPDVFPAFPEHPEFDVVASVDLCREIGGEFYDFFMIDNDHLALAVGDTSDKGIPAALYMVMVKTLIKNRALQGFSPAEIMQNVSEQLLEGNKSGMFATVWFAILELSTGKGMATNAGNEHPMLRKGGKKFELVEYLHSPPVGAMEGTRIRDHGFQLEPGDSIFIYTHGAKEVLNEKGEMFGTGRILEALNREPEASPSVLLQTVRSSVEKFAGDQQRIDGLTLLSLKYYGERGAADSWR